MDTGTGLATLKTTCMSWMAILDKADGECFENHFIACNISDQHCILQFSLKCTVFSIMVLRRFLPCQTKFSLKGEKVITILSTVTENYPEMHDSPQATRCSTQSVVGAIIIQL